MSLRGYLLKRAANTFVLIVFVITLNFFIFQAIPGAEGFVAALKSNPRVPWSTILSYLQKYGLCKSIVNGSCIPAPLGERLPTYLANMLTFQFGPSMQTGKPVLFDMISTGRLANTLILLGGATLVSLLVGTLLGVYTAAKRGSLFDSGWVTTSLFTFSLPTFWMGLLFILIFAQKLAWFPPGNVIDPICSLPGQCIGLISQIIVRLRHLFLPLLTLTLFFYGGHLLLTRATMMEALSEDYIVTAKAKGLSERVILFKHALKNAALPLVTNAALSLGGLLGGAIITETIFNWDGLGFWLFNAIGWKDFPVMQAMFFMIALCIIGANFLSDIIYGLVDPRVRYE